MPYYTSGYLSSGNYSYSVGTNNQASGRAVFSGYTPMNPQVTEENLDGIIKGYIKQNLELIENNDFDSFYKNLSAIYGTINDGVITAKMHETLEECNIEDIKHMTYIPNYFLRSSTINEFTIPSNIITVLPRAFALCLNLKKLIWHTKNELLNAFPSYETIYNLLLFDFPLIIEFPDLKYDKRWVKELRKFLKRMRKDGRYPKIKDFHIKFANKDYLIKVVK